METFLPDQFVGQTVGHCNIEQVLRHGHACIVYRAQQLTPNRPVALMVFLLPKGLPTHARQQFRARFLQEASALACVHHPNLVPLYSYGEWEGFPYLITSSLTEGSQATLLGQQGRCPPATILTVLEQVTAGLEHAHCSGFAHGALTPSSLLLSQHQLIQVAGLGLQRLLERRGILPVAKPYEHVLTLAGTWLVAPRYLAPECVQGQAADIRSDIYSLGVILFELLSGTPPFPDIHPLEIMKHHERHPLPTLHPQYADISPALDRVLQQALATDPALRFQRVSDLLTAFAKAIDEEASTPGCSSCPFSACVAQASEIDVLDSFSVPSEDTAMQQGKRTLFSSRNYAGIHVPWRRTRSGLRQHAVARRLRRLRRMSRRQVIGMLIAGGVITLGAGGIGVASIGLVEKIGSSVHQSPPVPSLAGASIGQTTQARNTARDFINPQDGKQSLLVHLPDGTFVAYEKACTHSGVLVAYDPATHRLVCPAHGAIFDPAQGGKVVQGPATRALVRVAIHVNSNGTITLGK